ncbi:hypothetical protein T07_14151 [Trichinella nelsoni]|uniref:Uncharacterized protein n=1 Tax=Trichinella nelsoni TaxID=6336 RepID=A0A0V0RCZ7_9BILA|nr:hypothetical protein T07_14151 [Trichinella nelsoni]
MSGSSSLKVEARSGGLVFYPQVHTPPAWKRVDGRIFRDRRKKNSDSRLKMTKREMSKQVEMTGRAPHEMKIPAESTEISAVERTEWMCYLKRVVMVKMEMNEQMMDENGDGDGDEEEYEWHRRLRIQKRMSRL